MSELLLTRFDEFSGSTVSTLTIDGKKVGYGLEDGHNDPKIAGETRIPAGRYPLKLRNYGGFNERYSNAKWIPEGMHKGMIEICDVPNFTHILFHTGNTKKHTEGCLLCGTKYSKNDDGYTVSNSRRAYLKIYPILAEKLAAGEEVYITVHNPVSPTK